MSSPGLEVLFASIQRDVRGAEDCVVCGVHWVLITNGFKCLGRGEQPTRENEKKSELLPPGWNESQDLYVLRYCQGTDIFVLKIVRADSAIMVHLMRSRDEKITSVNINTPDFVTQDWNSYDTAFTNVDGMERILREQLLGEFCKSNQSQAHVSDRPSQGERSRLDDDPLRIPPRHSQRPPPPEWTDPGNPFGVGRGDLDPFHRGGGMLMDPFRGGGRLPPGFDPNSGLPGRLPRGAVPPGARFDPFGPPGGPPGRRAGPDPDHARPPDYDDMFM